MSAHARARFCILAALSAVLLASTAARAQIVVSANDNKAILVDGVNSVPEHPAPDTVTILDFGVSPPKILGEVQAPASVVGPPQSVAIAPDESFALVTGAMKVDPADPKKVAPDSKLSVIDLKASPPAVTQTLEAGLGAAGVSINRAGTLALVANRNEGTVSVFTIAGKTLTPAGKIQLGDAKSGPSHVAFVPDGTRALVTRDGDHKISVLSVEGNKVEYAKRDMVGGIRPYSFGIGPKGDMAVLGNQGGGQGDSDVINVIDLKAQPPRIVDTISVPQTPEGISLSPDGAYVAVTLTNGSNRPKSSPFFNDFGLLRILRIDGTKLSPVTEAKIGHWCQGSVWSRDGHSLMVQCMVEKELQVLSFDGKELKVTGAVKINGGPAGIRTAERAE